MAEIVIIGAGLTGLSAAYHLEQKGFFDYLLFEKEESVGGLCRTVTQDGFTFDYTGHLLHASDPYFRTLLINLIGSDQLNSIERKSCIYSYDRYTPYPYQINLHGLPIEVIADCVQGFITRTSTRKKKRTFPDWVLENFGAGFARHFFLPFQQKIFAYDLNAITASWTGRFVPATSLEQIIQGIMKPNTEQIGYNAHFFYPKQGGIFSWVQALALRLKNSIQTNCAVEKIDLKEKIVIDVTGNHIRYKTLINTMPLDRFLTMTAGKSSSTVDRTAQKLFCNSVINFNLGINRENLSDKHWIYFPEKQYPFYRIGFPHNFSKNSVPPGCSSLYGEFAHINKSPAERAQTLIEARNNAQKLFSFTPADVITEKIISIAHAYVIYDFWRERNLAGLLTHLESESIYSIGRYGAWKYSSMQEALLDGKEIAERLVPDMPISALQQSASQQEQR